MPSSLRACTSCNLELPPTASFCPSCGKPTPAEKAHDLRDLQHSTPLAETSPAFLELLQRVVGEHLKIKRLLGRGGFGEVYAAWDERLKRHVALKTLRHDVYMSDVMLQRFRREAEAVAKLRHPHIVPIYTVGEGEGIVYFVMPLIEGETLAAYLARGDSVSVSEARRILREAASALGAAHRAQIIHRDVKPENIMLEGPERSTVVMDFGIAKLTGQMDPGLTGVGFIGSPLYMSPEQARGDRDLDHRSDQYSLATIGYQMLAGQLPMEYYTVANFQSNQSLQPAPPISELRTDLPPAFSAAISRALSKHRDERFPSMEEFSAALGPVADPSDSIDARKRVQPSLRERAGQARDTIARVWRPALVAGLVGLLAFIVLFTFLVPARGLAVAAQRDEAVFTGRRVLTEVGAPTGGREDVTMAVDDSAFAFLQRARRSGSLPDSRYDGLVWSWEFRRYHQEGNWAVRIGPEARVIEFRRFQFERSTGPAQTSVEARRVAERSLQSLGWQPEELRLVSGSTFPVPVVRHSFTWVPKDGVIRLNSDSAVAQIATTIYGGKLVDYRQELTLPQSSQESSARPSARTAITVVRLLSILATLGMLLLAASHALRRRGVDDLPRSLMLRMLAVATFPLLVSTVWHALLELTQPGNDGSLFSLSFASIFLVALPAVAVALSAISAESLAQETRPRLNTGVADLARARVFTPEFATAALVGYAAALALLGFRVVAAAAGQRILHLPMPAGLPSGFEEMLPSLVTLQQFSWATVATVAIWLCLSIALRLGLPSFVALGLPAILFGAFFAGGHPSLLYTFVDVAIVVCITALLWHYGVVACLIAVFVLLAMPEVVGLVRSGDSGFVTAGFVGLVLIAAPGILGTIAYRRLPRMLAARTEA